MKNSNLRNSVFSTVASSSVRCSLFILLRGNKAHSVCLLDSTASILSGVAGTAVVVI